MGTTRDVRAAVEAELGFDPLVDSADIKVITLTGHVRTWAEHDAVVGAAWMARGGRRSPRRAPGHRLTGVSKPRR